MTITIRERAGDTLLGAVDGSNQVYLTTFDFSVDGVAVYRNGLLLDPSRDNGYTVVAPREVHMKLAPLEDDTVEVEYRAAVLTGGGADGGCPDRPQLEVLAPDTEPQGEELPQVGADDLVPGTFTDEDRPGLSPDDLRPTLVRVENG